MEEVVTIFMQDFPNKKRELDEAIGGLSNYKN